MAAHLLTVAENDFPKRDDTQVVIKRKCDQLHLGMGLANFGNQFDTQDWVVFRALLTTYDVEAILTFWLYCSTRKRIYDEHARLQYPRTYEEWMQRLYAEHLPTVQE